MTRYLLIVFTSFLLTSKAQQTLSHVVHFATNKSVLSEKELADLNIFLQKTDSIDITGISILAYCDERGNTLYNDSLSKARAIALKEALLQKGFKESWFTKVEGRGELTLTGKLSKEKLDESRRAVIEITGERKKEKEAPKEETTTKKSVLSDNQKVGDKITLQNILFVGGRHFLLPESYPALDSLKQTLQEKKQYSIMILGHVCCQPPGNDGEDFDTGLFNLSVARAKVIYDYLIQNGIDPSRLEYKGLKSDFPTGKGDKYDRRVEIEITKVNEK
ncbi:MAG: OmpA family protein [Bacteroidia bacterium]